MLDQLRQQKRDSATSYHCYKKSPYRSVKHSTYFAIYDRLFQKYRHKQIVFVEVGVFGGGSLFMWRDFFGPKARIIGVDLNPNAKKWEKEGFEVHIGNQSDELFWRDFVQKVGPIDVVLDDGGHTYEQQIITTEMLLDNIRDGGMLVVEDTHSSYMDGFGPLKYSFIEFVKRKIDKLNYRSNKVERSNPDKKIWALHIYDSIVAFEINRNECERKSMVTDNGGFDDAALDYRYADNNHIITMKEKETKYKYLKNIPGVGSIFALLTARMKWRHFKAKKYFIENN